MRTSMAASTLVLLLGMIYTCVVANHNDSRPAHEIEVPCRPEQVHIAYGDTTSEVVVMWATQEECTTSVGYGTDPWGLTNTVPGQMSHFTDLNKQGLQCLHRVKLQGLTPETNYFYRPISEGISSGPFYFKTPPGGQSWEPEFLVYGDLGVESDSVPYLNNEVLGGNYTAVLHVGDFGYNLMDQDGQVGDQFMRIVEDTAARIPYMTSPGNHEIDGDTFSHYRHRFSMPNTDWPIPLDRMWYSIDIGLVHFVSYSSEVFFTQQGVHVDAQRNWLMADLKQANDNRNNCPWVIAYGHRPMYCSNTDGDDCTLGASKVREGLEDLFFNYGVDLVLQAHEHSYERLWPQYKGVVLAKNYSNPQAPIQLITGAAGSRHGVDEENKTFSEWSAFRMDIKAFNSFGRLKVYNATHLYWEQVLVKDSKVLDSIWVTQDLHGPFHKAQLDTDKAKKIEDKEKDNSVINTDSKTNTASHEEANSPHSGPDVSSGDTNSPDTSISDRARSMLESTNVRLALGIGGGILVLVVIITIVILQKQKKKARKYRRWDETVDYGRKFYSSGYSHVQGGEKDTDEFETEVNDPSAPTSKLLTE
ncbi:acid phosphatase type 7-like isoform X2 [Mizuhopecten yessoensis]|uniref:Purple acid phosphatase n=1 Tax=Mizuhopecten yessoensis TaxID=6573 RepID=A0A210PGK0_MIZYE|nr:acid phosphatase type 7-like isoform X2 [Mizuhopecten yessoensis]OWF35634.1 Iron/zinc purple acid phosphatase-like protein [Mizuhopecten yessoensis]